MAKSINQFQTIRSEGAVLPPDILQKIASLKAEGATAETYHLPPETKISEAISQSWNALRSHWGLFQEIRSSISDDDTGTKETNERWLLPLFKELDYGRLLTEKSPVIEERVYPIERFYNHTPIHLIGCNLPLDRRTKGARGAATASPHSMVQEFLNRSNEHLWAFLSNGLQLRILRDNVSLSRQAYVEFDLEAMMEGEVYADFALLWLLCHQSRIEAEKAENCWLEKWSHLAREQGTRILNNLRNGVASAIEALGQGFIGHPRNDRLRRKLQESGELSKEDFYRQLLRIVYRLLFLFVAEDRELLHSPDSPEEASDLYDKYYSMRRLRDMALRIRGSKHSDLWHGLSLVFNALGQKEGCPELGLPGLGSFLWNENSTKDLLGPYQINTTENKDEEVEPVFITNDDLLLAIRAIAYVEQDRVLRSVDYRNLGSEELGSVYESLLELHPSMHVEAKEFKLTTAAGNERKTTGSYYTPDSLVQCLLDSALDPVVEERLKGKKGEEAEEALLSLKVCDPACGSGHFLIAAAHRLAHRLARARTGEIESSPEDYQHALRDVIGHCIYGVDINPMATELCKVSLWMEALEPGKPLSFLDHRIHCGNSLLGTSPRLLSEGIPDDAFKAIEGDDKDICKTYKQRNKEEKGEKGKTGGQEFLFSDDESTWIDLGNLAASYMQIDTIQDDDIEGIQKKQKQYEDMVKSDQYLFGRLLADAWCAAFVWEKSNAKREAGFYPITQSVFVNIKNNPYSLSPVYQNEIIKLADQYQFFHWHLTYPDVFHLPGKNQLPENEQTGWDGGFDVILGNPPWERIKMQEDEWFASSQPDIAKAKTAAARQRLIENLESEDPSLYNLFKFQERQIQGTNHLIRSSGRYPLCGCGEINTYSIFAELNTFILDNQGMLGCILQAGIATDNTTRFFFESIVKRNLLHSLLSFDNMERIFPAVKPSTRFCLITIGGINCQNLKSISMVFYARSIEEAFDPKRRFFLTAADIFNLNPNTRTCPVFRSNQDASLVASIYRRIPVLVNEVSNTNDWGLKVRRIFDMNKKVNTDACTLSEDYPQPDDNLSMYEAKLVDQFNHRKQYYEHNKTVKFTVSELENPSEVVRPRYWIPKVFVESRLPSEWPYKWLLTWQDVTDVNTMARTVSSTIIPRAGSDFTLRVGFPYNYGIQGGLSFVSGLNSFVFDYVSRQMIGGIHLSDYILKQLPLPSPNSYSVCPHWHTNIPVLKWILLRVLELIYTAWDLAPFSSDCGYKGPPFRWNEERRFLLQCELDAAYFYIYLGIPKEWDSNNLQLIEMFPSPREAIDYIMDTFPIVKRKDIARTEIKNESGEIIQEGRYITKDTILEIYDEMQAAIDTGKPYQTRLDPPPGPPIDDEGNFIPMSQWDKDNWPSHIHLPKEQ